MIKDIFKSELSIIVPIRMSLAQSEAKLLNLSELAKLNYYYSTVILLISWLFATNILTKCFTSILLNTYFRQIPVPLINDLEQLLNEKTFLVATYEQTFPIVKQREFLTDEEFDNLHERYQLYLDVYKSPESLYERKVFDEMTKGNIIILFASHYAHGFNEFYALEKDKFFILDNKYLPQLTVHVAHKSSIFLDLQIFL